MGYEPGHLCPRCRQRTVNNRSAYCPPCTAEYHQERQRGEHARGRLCDKCGKHFGGKERSALCPECRLSFRERECSKCHQPFWAEGASLECPECRRRRQREYMRSYQQASRLQRREKMYGMQPGEWNRRLEQQDYKCASCSRAFGDNGLARDGAAMDHDHSCCSWSPSGQYGKPTCGKCNRDIICKRCNILIGLAGDDLEVLRSAIAYLGRWDRAALPCPEPVLPGVLS